MFFLGGVHDLVDMLCVFGLQWIHGVESKLSKFVFMNPTKPYHMPPTGLVKTLCSSLSAMICRISSSSVACQLSMKA
jgi:hypothetical protein